MPAEDPPGFFDTAGRRAFFAGMWTVVAVLFVLWMVFD